MFDRMFGHVTFSVRKNNILEKIQISIELFQETIDYVLNPKLSDLFGVLYMINILITVIF